MWYTYCHYKYDNKDFLSLPILMHFKYLFYFYILYFVDDIECKDIICYAVH